MFINTKYDQVLINTDKASTRILETDQAEEIVKKILAVRRNDLDEINLYELPVKDLTSKPQYLDNPPEECKVSLTIMRESQQMDEGVTQPVYQTVHKQENKRCMPLNSTNPGNGTVDESVDESLEESKDYTIETMTNTSVDLQFDSNDSDAERGSNL